MDNKDNNVNNFLSRYGRLIIYIAGIIVYFILLCTCISQVRQSNKLTTRKVSKDAIPEKIYFSLRADSLASNDTALITALNAHIDSLNFKIDSAIRLINTWNELCDNNLLHGFDDLRQETNNVIDKQNGWLSFWIAILALVGALLPLLIQMNSQQDQRHKFEEEKKDIRSTLREIKIFKTKMQKYLKTESDSSKSEIEKKMKEQEEEIEKKINEQKEGLNNFKDTLKGELKGESDIIKKILVPHQSNLYYSEISKLSFALIECSESILRIDDRERNKYCNDLLIKLHKMTGLFFTTIVENDGKIPLDKKINDLKIVLIQLLAAYNACKVLMTQKHRLMNLEKVTTNISEILQKLYDDNNIDDQKLTELLVQMDSIHIA